MSESTPTERVDRATFPAMVSESFARQLATKLEQCHKLIRQLVKHRGHVAAELVMDKMEAMMSSDTKKGSTER